MVHFLKQLVDSIYRPSYWYQLILHRAAYCLPAGTVALVRGGSGCNRRGPEATLMTNVWGRFFFTPEYKLLGRNFHTEPLLTTLL